MMAHVRGCPHCSRCGRVAQQTSGGKWAAWSSRVPSAPGPVSASKFGPHHLNLRHALTHRICGQKVWREQGENGLCVRVEAQVHTCIRFALLPRRLVKTGSKISLKLREGDGSLSRSFEGRRGVLLVLRVALVLVLVRSQAATDTLLPVLAAQDQLQLAVLLNLDLSHTFLHRNDGLRG